MKIKKKIINNIFYLNNKFRNIIKFIFLKMEVQSLENQAKNIVMDKLIKLTEKYPNKDWNWKKISEYPYLTIEIIEKYIDKPWDWKYLTNNVSLDFVDKYPNKNWSWYQIFNNPNITIDFFEKHLDKVDWFYLSYINSCYFFDIINVWS